MPSHNRKRLQIITGKVAPMITALALLTSAASLNGTRGRQPSFADPVTDRLFGSKTYQVSRNHAGTEPAESARCVSARRRALSGERCLFRARGYQ